MSTAKFEKLIDLIINEDQERAEQLFHEIVVEKSREIYENIIDEDMTTDMIDEISSEEEGMDDMMEDDEEFTDDEEIDGDFDVDSEEDFGDEEVDLEMDVDSDHHDDMGGNEELEDRVVDLEDKLDELMAEFESLMGDDGDDDEVDMEVDVEDDDDMVAEATEMKKVAVTHNDGSDKSAERSPVDANSGQKGMASKPVNFDMGGDETVPTSPKKPSNYGTKGEGEIKGSASWKNKVGGDTATGKGRGESAPKPVNKQPAGGDQRSPVPESKRIVKKMVK